MKDNLNSNSYDEIDFREFFLILWTYKLLIAFTCAMGILYGGYSALNANKEFTSSAIFHISNDKPNSNLSNINFGSLARLTGFGNPLPNDFISTSQINGRVFIKNIDTKMDLQSDPFFNNYNPEKVAEPLWKSAIKDAIGLQKNSIDIQETIWQGITNKFSKNVFVEQNKNGVIVISVTHRNSIRAAKLANAIMEEIIFIKKQKSVNQQNSQLEYLSNTLAKALDDLETSQANLKAFALENSIVPLESFTVETLQLEKLREQLNRTTELLDAVTRLSLMLKNNNTSKTDYQILRKTYPIVDQVEFRRVLGQNEIISSWKWPDISSITAVIDTLSERKSRLKSKIDVSQIAAQRSSLALETYSQLEREAEISEAAYTVLTEQVKAQSMLVGYRPSTSEVYEYASPSVIPSKPNPRAIIMLQAFLGLIIGSILSLIIASNRGVFYSKKSLAAAAQTQLNLNSRTLNLLRNKNLVEINTPVNRKKLRPILRDIAVEINKDDTTLAIVTSSRAKIKASEVACALGLNMQSIENNIAVIDFSNKRKDLNLNTTQSSIGSFVVSESADQVSVLIPESNLKAIELISQKQFLKNIHLLSSDFNLIFLCADNGDAISLLRALEGQKIFHLMLARIKHTNSDTLKKMRSFVPIQGLLHD